MKLFFLFLSFFTTTFAIYIGEDRDSSSESHESYGGRRGHKHRHHYNDDDNYEPRPPRQQCEDGWTFFQRPSGGWCMKVFPGTWDQAISESQCQSQGAVLSGIQNQAELNWIVSTSLIIISPQVSGGVWIGIKRRPECLGQIQTDTCTKTNSFYWTDNSTSGIKGMVFQLNEPNNGNAPPGPNRNQDCALLSVAHTPTFDAVSTYWSGQMDDIYCFVSGTSYWPPGTLPRVNRAYVCGKKSR